MTAFELITITAMVLMAVFSRSIGEWFTAERGIEDGRNGWV